MSGIIGRPREIAASVAHAIERGRDALWPDGKREWVRRVGRLPGPRKVGCGWAARSAGIRARMEPLEPFFIDGKLSALRLVLGA